MTLAKYSKKRDFKKTTEPKGLKKKSGKKLSFVVQRHYATHLHYDFRLEMEGVLKSWAVPKGPSLNPADKRLAMMVEDHPFEYRKFAGTILEGNYGAGEVEIWDKGSYAPLTKSEKLSDEKELLKELKSGNLKFKLEGTQLKGEFALVKIKNASQENVWLLIKHKDTYAKEKYDAANHDSLIVKHKKKATKAKANDASHEKVSIKTGKEITKSVHRNIRSSVGGRIHVRNYIKPMLAKSTEKPFDDSEWIFELKWDGYRAITETGKELKLYSRNGISFLNYYPNIEEELHKIKKSFVLDGEIVATDEKGIPSFQLLQNYEEGDAALTYYVFDILKLRKKDLTSLPLLERKAILKKELKESAHVKYSDHIIGQGKKFFEAAKKKELEGIIAKKGDGIYSIGLRSANWLKIKNNKGQEAVIAGFTAPRNSRKFFGSLVLGIFKGEELIYCGHTGTGFDEQSLEDLHVKLMKLKRSKSPFRKPVKTNMPVTWVKPELVCNIKFTEMTREGIMRHPVFQGLRIDKKAKEVVNEKKIAVKPVSHKKIKKAVT
jgi:bifunctional non-homologous end joining protein LigD